MRQRLPTGTVTFLFTDIEGSTRLWEANPDAMRPALARHDALVRRAIEASGGVVFKTIGDAFCAAFPTAPAAAEGALAAQTALLAEPWPADLALRARMALHAGAADEREGDYFGQPVNRAARLLAAGHGGQTLVSAAAQELIRDALPAQCALEDLGDAQLKDLARSERVYQLRHPDLPSEFPPLRCLSHPGMPNNLPQQATSFIGREAELEKIKALLRTSRLLTLVGAGGAGKTRLALQAAADLLDGSGDGVWFVELAPLSGSDAALAVSETAQALGIKETAGQPLQKTLVEALRGKSLLIVLDNCEHLLDACRALASDLLRSCPGVHLLATSREPLGVAGEQVYRVPSMPVPARARSGAAAYGEEMTAESLTAFDSARLFIERAQAAQPAFTVTDQNAPAVAQLCAHLDGIPLAIELAAARVRSMAVDQVNARLDQRFRLLTGGARDRLPRQQTLKALIDWSYDQLGAQERTMLARCSAFSGGWTLDAAEQACAGEAEGGSDVIEEWEALDLLTSLVDKSLVGYDDAPSGDASGGRYGLLESIRQYAQERLAESGGADAAGRRHWEWSLALALEAEPQLSGPDAAAWLSRLEQEHDNFRSALQWSERQSGGDAAIAQLRLALALGKYWQIRGHWTEGRQWLSRALERIDTDSLLLDGDVSELKASALNVAGLLAMSQGDYAAAHALIEGGLLRRRALGKPAGIAASLQALGNAKYNSGDLDAALAIYEECRDAWHESGGDDAGEATALQAIGIVLRSQGDQAGARARMEQSLAIRRRLGDQAGTATSLSNLGYAAWGQQDYPTARAFQEESLTIRRALGDQLGIALSLNGLGIVSYDEGDFDAARGYFEESLQIKRRLGDQIGVALSLANLGAVTQDQGDTPSALAMIREGLELMHRLGNRWGVADLLDILADIADAQGRREQAGRLWGAVAAQRERIGFKREPAQQAGHDERRHAARAAVGEDAFDSAWSEGLGMDQSAAVEYALAEAG